MVYKPLQKGDRDFSTGKQIDLSKFGTNKTFIGREYTLAIVDSQLDNPKNYQI